MVTGDNRPNITWLVPGAQLTRGVGAQATTLGQAKQTGFSGVCALGNLARHWQ
jgi:hypothetical protein